MLHNLDSDSSKIIEAVRSTGVVITEAMRLYVDYIVSNMKNIGTWQLSNAVYGFVGGTAASHKWNWKDLRDVDAAFRLTYAGGVIHSANGIQFNGSTGYADSKIFPATTLTNTSTHLYSYIKTSSTTTSTTTPYIMGALNNPTSNRSFGLVNRHNGTSNLKAFISSNPTSADIVSQTTTTATAFLKSYSGNLYSGFMSLWNNGVEIIPKTFTDLTTSDLPTTISLLIGASSAVTSGGVVNHDNKLLSCVMIGAGLTDTQIIQRDQIINNAQNILNRA